LTSKPLSVKNELFPKVVGGFWCPFLLVTCLCAFPFLRSRGCPLPLAALDFRNGVVEAESFRRICLLPPFIIDSEDLFFFLPLRAVGIILSVHYMVG